MQFHRKGAYPAKKDQDVSLSRSWIKLIHVSRKWQVTSHASWLFWGADNHIAAALSHFAGVNKLLLSPDCPHANIGLA